MRSARRFDPLDRALKRLSDECEGALHSRKAPMDDLSLQLNRLIDECDLWLQTHPQEEHRDAILEIYFHLVSCRRIFELYDDDFITWYENDAARGFHLRLYCLNPAARIQERLSCGKAAVYFSANALALAVLCHAAGRTGKGKAHRPALHLQHGSVCPDHPRRHFHPLAAPRSQCLADRERHLSQRDPQARQLHRLLSQLPLHGNLRRAVPQTLSRHPAACAGWRR